MKAIDRRLRRLQESFAPQENEEVRRLVTLLRERRRRRAEACGEPFEDRPCEGLTDDQERPLSVADILRSGCQRVPAPNQGLNSQQCQYRSHHALVLSWRKVEDSESGTQFRTQNEGSEVFDRALGFPVSFSIGGNWPAPAAPSNVVPPRLGFGTIECGEPSGRSVASRHPPSA
jgi:hypothetical protein